MKLIRLPLLLAFISGIGLLSAQDSDILPPLYLEMDTDKSGDVSEAEYLAFFAAKAKANFAKVDKNGDKTLKTAEIQPVKPVIQSKKTVSEQNLFERLFIGDGTIPKSKQPGYRRPGSPNRGR